MFFWGGYSFCQHFLRTRTNYPRLHRILNGMRWLGAASIPFGLFDLISQAVSIVTLANLIFFVTVIYLGISSTRKGLNSAPMFLISWSGMVICSVTYNLYVQGLLPSNFFVQRAMLIGVAYESVLMSVAQANFLRNVHLQRAQREATAKEEALQALSKLDVALADARDANRSKDEFLRLVSHELRTPITHALGALDELTDSSLDEGKQSLVDVLQNATRTTHHQVESLLSYAELLAYPVVSRPSVVDMRARLQDCKQRLTAAVVTHGRACTLSGEETLPAALQLDWHNTQHILDHLLDTALQHSLSGDIAMSVHFDETAQRLNLSLRQPNPIDTIHSTSDPASGSPRFSGPTLNLYLSQAFADILEAELTREQYPDHTLTRLSLPCTEAPTQTAPNDAVNSNGASSLEGMRILIVEDNLLNLKLLTAILQRELCQMDLAYDGVGAVEQASSGKYDFILMDCQMPKMDGFEATRLIRKTDGPNRNTPILAITANTMERDRDEAFAAGMDDLIPKPFTRPMLVERLLHWQQGRTA
jgi:CheY-like chemotaxis protein/signal transduction histidine kinase